MSKVQTSLLRNSTSANHNLIPTIILFEQSNQFAQLKQVLNPPISRIAGPDPNQRKK